MTVRIDDHDYETKTQHARKFLEQGNKVKCTIRMKGREMQHAGLAYALARRFVNDLLDVGHADSEPRLEGRTVTANMSPGKKK